MPLSLQGQSNLTSLVVPGVYVVIQPPASQNINGVPTNVLGVVGTATWGPVNAPVVAGSLAQAAAVFGPLQPRKYDLLTPVATASQQGANNFRLVRVTDGTDVAATIAVLTNCVSFTSIYTGTFGNGIVATLSAGSAVNSFKVVISAPGLVPEVFDNIGVGLTGSALWTAVAAAINVGTSALRGPSQIVVASAGGGTSTPVLAAYSLVGGTDGAGSVTATNLLGQDTVPRAGMYALRNTGSSVGLLSDCDTSTAWATQVAFGISEGIYMIMTGPAGDNIANAVSVKSAAGIDAFDAKLMFGDWIYWLDTYNNQYRLVSPQGFVAGELANLSPQNSTLNKQLQGISGSQLSYAAKQYSQADLQSLIGAGIDVIANPSPGGTYFSCQSGHNTSSNPLTNSDAYTRMINYIAATLQAGMGRFVGMLNSAATQAQAIATLGHYFDGLQSQGMIGNPANPNQVAYSIVLNATNNPQAQVALGYLQASIQVQFLAIVEKLILAVQGGASVQIQSAGVALA